MSPDHVAQCAQLAMLIELSSTPKPGNIDRCHDFHDATFQHFLASAVSAYPIFKMAAAGGTRFGQLLLGAIKSWRGWNIKGNTHFGSLVLMIPLAISAGRSDEAPQDLKKELGCVLRETTLQDAIDFYSAFELAAARVIEVERFSLKDHDAKEHLQKQSLNLLDLMLLSKEHDLIAREWSTDYCTCFVLSDALLKSVAKNGLNVGVARTYLKALAEAPDSLVRAKFGLEKAVEVSLRARKALDDTTMAEAEELDRELLAEDINPGATADIIAAALFIALLRGLRF